MAGSGDDWAPPSARRLDDDDWAPKSARRIDAPVFTGKEERAAEEKKLTDSLNPLERLAIGAGHGMYNTHLNISDLLGRLPGNSGARVDPAAWRDQEQLYGRTLGKDVAAGVGDLAGQTAMLAPVGGGAGAVTRAALPQALAAVAPLLTMGAEGAAQGAIAAGPDNRGEGALTGLKFGLGTGAAGQLLGSVSQLASGGQDSLRAGALSNAREAQDALERTAGGELGAAVQKGSRFEEQFANYAEDPNLPEDLRAALQAWRGSQQSKELVSSVLRNQLGEAPAVAGQIAAKRSALDALQTGREDAVRASADASLSFGEAKRQALQRAIRYGLPALGGAMLGPAGLAEGAVLRPMMHSAKRYLANPAFQYQALRALGGLSGGLSGLANVAALGEGGLVPFTLPESTGAATPAFANDPRTLGQLAYRQDTR